jgi:propanol-preferring alcohol dehydrogenase
MNAAVLHEIKKPLAIEEVPRPNPGADEVLIEVETCGVCPSDLHLADGDWSQLAGIMNKPPILGHEIVSRERLLSANFDGCRGGAHPGLFRRHATRYARTACNGGRGKGPVSGNNATFGTNQ